MTRDLRALVLVCAICLGLEGARSAAASPSETDSGLERDGLARIQRSLANREYEASQNGQGLQAPNRAHDLRSYFGPDGVRVHDRTDAASPALLSLRLTGLGRAEPLAPVLPGVVTSQGARVEIRRPGLTEWFLNSEVGLEQGFTLAERPAGDGQLVLEFALDSATASVSGDDLVFATSAGRRLRYGALHVSDAAGRALAARFELASPDRVRIAVDDARAAYPVVVDPLLTAESDSIVEADQDFANLGTHVASAGDVNGDGYADVIAGAQFYDDGENDEGAAFVFHGGPNGIGDGGPTSAEAKITSDQFTANLGKVAGVGDVNGDGYDDVVVGAQAYNAGQGAREGAAWVFLGGPSGVGNGSPSNADAMLEGNEGEGWFASSLSGGDVNGDGYADVIVGAFRQGAGDAGAAYVFHGSATGIANGNPATADTVLTSAQAGGEFGVRVGAGDVNGDGYADVIVGAWLYDNGSSDEGVAFVYHGSASGIADGGPGTAATVLESNQASAHFGVSLAGAGDVNGDGYADVVVGAELYDNGNSNEGAAFVFHGSGSGVASGNLTSASGRIESEQDGAQLGWSVGGAGDVNGDGYADVIVGAFLYDQGGTDDGGVFVLLGGASGVGNHTPSTAFAALYTTIGSSSRLGHEVAGAGDVNGDGYGDVIAGAIGYEEGNTDEGAAFVYHGGALGIVHGSPSNAAARLEADSADSDLGYSVADAGDVNGDGYSDVIVGAHRYDGGLLDRGAAFILHGSAAGIANANPSNAATSLLGDQADALFGESVAGAGDVNGDGYADVIIGASQYDDGQNDEGAAFLFLGSASGIAGDGSEDAAARFSSNQVGAEFGYSVAGADVNGDGFSDLILSAVYYDAGESNEGAAFVFPGAASGIPNGTPASAATRLEADAADAHFGYRLANAGDVNGDGFADVIVGREYFSSGESNEGAAYLFHGSASGIANANPASAATRLQGNNANAFFGRAVSGAGDVNADGYADVIVGAPLYDGGQSDEGAAYVFHGGATGIGDGGPAQAATSIFGLQSDAQLGFSVGRAGDVDGDGYADVIVGARGYETSEASNEEGAGLVFLGGASGVQGSNPASAAARLESDQAQARMGWSVSSAGDVNGDGHADVVVGALLYDAGQTNEGAAFVFYGGGNQTGRSVLARQLRGGSGATLVQPWGASYTADFRVRATATHPLGRGRVKLQVQTCPVAVPLGHASCATSTSPIWTDVTASSSGATLTHSVTGLADDTLRRWRARVLYAPYTVTQTGITAPPNPAHGPWRRPYGQVLEADLRVRLDTDLDGTPNSSDTDDDGDGLLDVHETDTGTFVSPTNTGTDPLDSDSDDDGLFDGPEVALGTDPNDSDHDDDGDLDGADNCPLIVNANQANGDTWGAGDACQCGDVTGDGVIAAADYQLARQHVVKGTTLPAMDRCDVNGDDACDVEDLAVLERLEALVLPPPQQLDGCDAYTNP